MIPSRSRCIFRRRTAHPTTPVVLSNVRYLENNPYAATWVSMLYEAGAVILPMSLRRLHSAGAGTRTWLHVQWPEFSISGRSRAQRVRKLSGFVLTLLLARARRNTILLTVHNLRPHGGGLLPTLTWQLCTLLCTDVHLMSGAALDQVFRASPALRRKRVHVIPHVAYSVLAAPLEPVVAGRCVFFGRIRPYKGLDQLITAFADLKGPSLRVVGQCDQSDVQHELRILAESGRSDVSFCFQSLSEPDLLAEIIDADLAVLPYRAVLNSGSAILALSAGRPVLVPRTPSFIDIQSRVGARWVHLFEGDVDERDITTALASMPTDPIDLSWCGRQAVVEKIRALLTGRDRYDQTAAAAYNA